MRSRQIAYSIGGAWCPYCQAQLAGFQRASEKLAETGIKVVALSVDDEATTVGTIEKFKLSFPLGHSAKRISTRRTGFLLAPDGKILNAVYSSGPIGRLVAEDVVGMVAYLKSKAKGPSRRHQEPGRARTGLSQPKAGGSYPLGVKPNARSKRLA